MYQPIRETRAESPLPDLISASTEHRMQPANPVAVVVAFPPLDPSRRRFALTNHVPPCGVQPLEFPSSKSSANNTGLKTTVKQSVQVPTCGPGLLTSTFRSPAVALPAMEIFAVICKSLTKVTEFTVMSAPKLTSR